MVWLLQALGLREREDVFTIYIGDDMTDEDAFQVRAPPSTVEIRYSGRRNVYKNQVIQELE
jgi:trehalose-6-phosphatase